MCWWIIERHEYVLTCCEVRKGIDIGTLTPCEAAKANGKHCAETVVEDRGRTFLQIDHCELCESVRSEHASNNNMTDSRTGANNKCNRRYGNRSNLDDLHGLAPGPISTIAITPFARYPASRSRLSSEHSTSSDSPTSRDPAS